MEFQDRQSERSTNDSVTVAKPRKHLTTAEMEKLIEAASGNRHAHRDRTALLLAYRHASCDATRKVRSTCSSMSVDRLGMSPVFNAWSLERLGKPKFPFAVSSHALRHSCGFKLASDGQDTRAISHYLGHKSLASTAIYTALAHDRFKNSFGGTDHNVKSQ